MLLIICVAAALVWLLLGYRVCTVHGAPGRSQPGWELLLEYVVAATALFCLLRLVLNQLGL